MRGATLTNSSFFLSSSLFLRSLHLTHFGDIRKLKFSFPSSFGTTRRNVKKIIINHLFTKKLSLCVFLLFTASVRSQKAESTLVPTKITLSKPNPNPSHTLPLSAGGGGRGGRTNPHLGLPPMPPWRPMPPHTLYKRF